MEILGCFERGEVLTFHLAGVVFFGETAFLGDASLLGDTAFFGVNRSFAGETLAMTLRFLGVPL